MSEYMTESEARAEWCVLALLCLDRLNEHKQVNYEPYLQ